MSKEFSKNFKKSNINTCFGVQFDGVIFLNQKVNTFGVR